VSGAGPAPRWPYDPATPGTPVATSAGEVAELAAGCADLAALDARSSVCRACPRLVGWREQVAVVKRRSYAEEPYWARPVVGWGPPDAGVLVVGLAPAAHGGNRTGRIFTGDRSGDWLFAALHAVGLAAQPTSTHPGDGQRLLNTRLVAAVRCAPPDNRPTPAERDSCTRWLAREVALLAGSLRVVVALGQFAWQALWPVLDAAGWVVPRPRPRFGHGAAAELDPAAGPGRAPLLALASYHPSQQNTFTGRLTAPMLEDVLGRAAAAAGAAGAADVAARLVSRP